MNTPKCSNVCIALLALCLVSITSAQNYAYIRQFYTSSDCSETSRIAHYYMPDTAFPCRETGCFEIVAGMYGIENCTDPSAKPTAKDGWSVVIYSTVDGCDPTQIEYAAEPETCFVFSGTPENPYSYKLSNCLDGKIFVGNYPDTTCTAQPSLFAVNTTDMCTGINGGYYKHTTCPLPPVAPPVADIPQSEPGTNSPGSNTTPQSPVAAPTKKSSTGANLKLDLGKVSGSVLLLVGLLLV